MDNAITIAPGNEDPDGVSIRDRAAGDLEPLVAMADRVRSLDGYPVFLGDGGLRRFLTEPPSLVPGWPNVMGSSPARWC